MINTTKLALEPIIKSPMIQQLTRFGVVGCSAAVINFFIVVALVHLFTFPPLLANAFAFLIAFQISFLGHKYWTFGHDGGHFSTMSKFFIVAIASFFLNEALFAFFLHTEHLFYPIALGITLMLVPPITFVFSKIWAFR